MFSSKKKSIKKSASFVMNEYDNQLEVQRRGDPFDVFGNAKVGRTAWRHLHIPNWEIMDAIRDQKLTEKHDYFSKMNLRTMFQNLDSDGDGKISEVSGAYIYIYMCVFGVYIYI
jgi:hypothetical protein